MKLILDTHVLLWWLDNPTLLSKDAQQALSDPNNAVFVSSAVLWEIAIKHGLGKLSVAASVVQATRHYICARNCCGWITSQF